jgi:hypothetical protein
MISNRTAGEDAIRERSDAYAAVHPGHAARQQAERDHRIAEIDQVTAAYAARVALRYPMRPPDYDLVPDLAALLRAVYWCASPRSDGGSSTTTAS